MTQEKIHPWRVIYTKSRYEKVVEKQFTDMGIEVYLPLIKQLRLWSDRKQWVELPLFPNYIFLRADDSTLFELLKTPGVVKAVYHAHKPVLIRDKQMEDIIRIVNFSEQIEVENDSLIPGSKVRISSGPFKGIKGTLVERKGKYKFSFEVEAIRSCLLIEIDLKQVRKIVKS